MEGQSAHLPAAAVASHAAQPATGLKRREAVLRICGAAACLAVVLATAAIVGGEGSGSAARGGHGELLSQPSDNYYVDARIAQHREERMQELNELRREEEEKRERKSALEAQEARQVRDEDAMANKALERYNDIYTASTPEEAALDSQTDTVSGSAREDARLDQKFDQYDSPGQPAGTSGLRQADSADATVPATTQNLASAQHVQNIQGLVRAADHDLENLEGRLEQSSSMMQQRGSAQLKDILESSMLEMKGLAKRVGVQLDRSPAPASQPPAAPRQPHMAAAAPVAAPVSAAAMPSVKSDQAADDKKIRQERSYPSMQSMMQKYKAWMAAKKEMEETGSASGVSTEGLSSVPMGHRALVSVSGPCAQINRAHAGDTAARENACAHAHACHFDFGYQLCLVKK
jgi:hypothetical protein